MFNFFENKEYSWEILLKKFLETILLIIVFLFIISKWITLIMVERFIFIMLLLNLYSLISYAFEKIIDTILKGKEMFVINKYERILLSIILMLYNVFNPVLYLYLNLLPYIYYNVRWVNHRLHINVRIIYIKFFMNFILKPFYRVFIIYYKALKRIKERTIIELIFSRTYGLIVSILIMGSVIIYLYSNIYLLIFILYSYLILLGFLPEKLNLKMDKDLIRPVLGNILELRMKNTILGSILNKYLIEKDLRVYFSNIYFCDSNLKKYYIGFLGPIFSVYKEVINERKYVPSYSFVAELTTCFIHFTVINKIYYGLYELKLEEKDKDAIMQILKRRKDMMKKGLFFIWDLEEYTGVKYNMTYNNEDIKCINIEFDFNIDNFYESVKNKENRFMDIKEYIYDFLPIFIYGYSYEWLRDAELLTKITEYNIYHEEELFKRMENFLSEIVEELRVEWIRQRKGNK